MQLTTVREIYKNRETFLDKEITVGGWVRSVRDSKTFGFIVLHDGTFFETLQVVYHDSMENFAEISRLNVGAAIIVKGTLVATPQAKQPFEIQATEISVEGASAPDYPVSYTHLDVYKRQFLYDAESLRRSAWREEDVPVRRWQGQWHVAA